MGKPHYRCLPRLAPHLRFLVQSGRDKSGENGLGRLEAPRASHRGRDLDLCAGGEDADVDVAFERREARLKGISASRYRMEKHSDKERRC